MSCSKGILKTNMNTDDKRSEKLGSVLYITYSSPLPAAVSWKLFETR